MRLIVDASALLCRYLPDARQDFVDRMMESAGQVVVTDLARTEVELGIHQAIGSPQPLMRDHPLARLTDDWDRFWVLPVDRRCLRRAADVGRSYGLNLVNSLHIAAFDAVPRPASLLTVDDRQAAAAADLGFDLIDVLDQGSAHGLLRPD